MPEPTDDDWAALADRLTDPATPLPSPTRVLQGDAAAASGHEFMLREYGSEEALAAALHRAGRPRAGDAPRGSSPTVRGRIPEIDFAAFKLLEQRTGKGQSELVREAVHLLLERYRAAS